MELLGLDHSLAYYQVPTPPPSPPPPRDADSLELAELDTSALRMRQVADRHRALSRHAGRQIGAGVRDGGGGGGGQALAGQAGHGGQDSGQGPTLASCGSMAFPFTSSHN